MTEGAGKGFIDLTASIVSAYVSNNPTPASEIPALIGQVHAALVKVSAGQTETLFEPIKPAVSVKKSLTPDYIICLEDGKKFKSLKRHLRTQYSMTPEQYREKWLLPTMPSPARNWQSKWGWASNIGRPADLFANWRSALSGRGPLKTNFEIAIPGGDDSA
jgi:predicted transcriptional regulator